MPTFPCALNLHLRILSGFGRESVGWRGLLGFSTHKSASEVMLGFTRGLRKTRQHSVHPAFGSFYPSQFGDTIVLPYSLCLSWLGMYVNFPHPFC